ncbi:MAG: histidine kinase [Bryobacteraceae bacterium]|nr:histidine kinase [Bryobacteraceae bacterium]
MRTPAIKFVRSALWGLAYPAVLFVLDSSLPAYTYARAAGISVCYSFCIGMLAEAILPLTGRWMASFPRALSWLLVLLTLLAIACVGSLAGSLVLMAAQVFPPSYFWRWYGNALRIAVVITVITGIAMYVYTLLRGRLEETRLELKTKELEWQRALHLATEAKLSSLESRVHPHFLFNTINSISALIQEDPKRAERMLGQMASLLRFSLDTHRRLIPLQQELQIVRDYLDLESARFEHRLRYRIDAPAELHACLLPPHSIQTLVENSVKFAVAPRRGGGSIAICAWREDDRLYVSTSDDGPGFTEAALQTGHGLDSLRARLETVFPGQAALALEPVDGGMRVLLHLPAIKEDHASRLPG